MEIEEVERIWKSRGYAHGGRMGGVSLWAHDHPGYHKRTQANAECDATIAVAADYSTGGERLTKQVAGPRYLPLPLFLDPEEAGSRLKEFLEQRRARSLNVAGNGIYTLESKGWSQDAVDAWLHVCLRTGLLYRRLAWIQSGGQTGLDMSGAICAAKLGVPALILMPAGFKQRDATGSDSPQDPASLLALIHERARSLPDPAPSLAAAKAPNPF